MSNLDLRMLLTQPFEVYYDRLSIKQYELTVAKEPKLLQDFTGVEISTGSAYGITFRSANSTGAEILCTVGNDFVDIVPDWLQMVNEKDCEINFGEKCQINVEGDTISFESSSDDEDVDFSHWGSTLSIYLFDDNQDCKYIILDPDGLAVKVSLSGYAVDHNGDEIKSQLILDMENLWDSESISPSAQNSMDEVIDKSHFSAIDARKEAWLNSELSTVLNGRILTLSSDSE